MSNREFDRYGLPKKTVSEPYIFREAVVASEEPEGELKILVRKLCVCMQEWGGLREGGVVECSCVIVCSCKGMYL